MAKSALTSKQTRFVEEFLVDFCATKAATRAGYSQKTAYSIGSENLTKPEIVAAIKLAMAERSKRTEITQDKVVSELAKIGFSDIRNAVRWGKSPIDANAALTDQSDLGNYLVEPVPSHEIDGDTAAAISEVVQTSAGIKIKMYDKRAALVDLGKHLGMYDRDKGGELHIHISTEMMGVL